MFKANLNGSLAQKNTLRNNFKNCQNIFDNKFRYFKRKHKKEDFQDLEMSAKNNPTEMWKKYKQLSGPSSTRAALEIVREDESISTDIKEILQRWHKDISNLFSGLRDNPEFAFDDTFYDKIVTKQKMSLKPCAQRSKNCFMIMMQSR